MWRIGVLLRLGDGARKDNLKLFTEFMEEPLPEKMKQFFSEWEVALKGLTKLEAKDQGAVLEKLAERIGY